MIQKGQRLELPQLRIYWRHATPTPQVACIVGKKVHRLATVRHRYQRLLREAARSLIRSGLEYDMVMVAKPEILTLKKLSQLQDVLKPHFQNLV